MYTINTCWNIFDTLISSVYKNSFTKSIVTMNIIRLLAPIESTRPEIRDSTIYNNGPRNYW